MRYKNSLWSLAVLAAAFMAVPTACMAQDASQAVQPSQIVVHKLNLSQAELRDATESLSQMTGIQFIYMQADKPYKMVTLNLSDVTAETALEDICKAAGAYFHKDENGVYVISPTPIEAPAADPAAVPAKPKIEIARITLLHADPKVVYEMLLNRSLTASPNHVFDTRVFDEMHRFSRDSYTGTAPTRQTAEMLAAPQQVSANFNSQTANSQGMLGSADTSSSNGVQLPGDSANQIGGIGGGGRGGFGGGGRGGGGLSGGGGGLNGGGGGLGGGLGGQQTQLTPGSGFVPAGIQHIEYDPTDNSIIVSGPQDDINKLKTIVNQFDTVPKQVQIKVEFITTSTNINKDIGFDWLYQRGAVSAGNIPGSFTSTNDPIFLNYSVGNIVTRMRTLLTQGYGKAVSAPVITTLNNEPATVFSAVTTYFETSTSSITSGVIQNNVSIQQLQIPTILTVAPRINNDNTITMYLQPTITQISGQVRLPDGTTLPVQSSEGVNVVVRVPNGQTVVLGGINQKNDTGSENKFPILGDLPIIGQFFRQRSSSQVDNELLIFVTPTIVQDNTSNSGL